MWLVSFAPFFSSFKGVLDLLMSFLLRLDVRIVSTSIIMIVIVISSTSTSMTIPKTEELFLLSCRF